MPKVEMDRLLLAWGEQARLREGEVSVRGSRVAGYPGPLRGAHEACVGPWEAFWESMDRMLRCMETLASRPAEFAEGAGD